MAWLEPALIVAFDAAELFVVLCLRSSRLLSELGDSRHKKLVFLSLKENGRLLARRSGTGCYSSSVAGRRLGKGGAACTQTTGVPPSRSSEWLGKER